MRHLVKGKKLGRSASHRKAMLRSLAISLIREHRITTTVTKAKALRPFIEPIITRAKKDTSHNRRTAFSKLNNKKAVTLLFDEVGVKAKERAGGYTRIIKLGTREGDGAEMAVMELVDYNDIKPEDKSSISHRSRRSGS
jgi:large subunit ribosomal protein L17